MSNKTFPSYEAFSKWIRRGLGKIQIPMPNAKGWVLELAKRVAIRSTFYDIEQSEPYGAPIIRGHCVPFAGQQCSGVIEFGFDESVPVIVNRRRLTEDDQLEAGQRLVAVIECQPDRVNEPVAVIVMDADLENWRALNSAQWLNFMGRVRDGLEVYAVERLSNFISTWTGQSGEEEP